MPEKKKKSDKIFPWVALGVVILIGLLILVLSNGQSKEDQAQKNAALSMVIGTGKPVPPFF